MPNNVAESSAVNATPAPAPAMIEEVSENNIVCDNYRDFADRCSFRRGWCRHEMYPYNPNVWVNEDEEEEQEFREWLDEFLVYLEQELEENRRRQAYYEATMPDFFKPSSNN